MNKQGSPSNTPQKPYAPVTLPELLDGPTEIDWLIDGVVPIPTSGILAGDSGIGKTWMVLDLAIAVATGESWLGHFNTQQGTVLIVDEDNAELLLRVRLLKLLAGRNLKQPDEVPISFLVGQHVNPRASSD